MELGRKARKAGAGWEATCPGHDDRAASLSISTGEDGRLLLHCHAGCETVDLLAAVGWEISDMFQPKDAPTFRPPAKLPAKTWPTIKGAVEAARRSVASREGEAAEAGRWMYGDVAAVVRFNIPTPAGEKQKKTFRPLHKEAGGWATGDPAGLWPLYRFAELEGCTRVYVCEGEKAADAAASVGLAATTSAHGAKAAEKSDCTLPASVREAVVLPDHDDAGEGYAADVAARIRKANPNVSVRIVRLADAVGEGFPKGGDFHDFANDFRDGQDAENIRAEVEALADAAPIQQVEPVKDAATADADAGGASPVLVCLADVTREPIRWTWRGRIPRGKITMFAGDPGLGKSLMTMDLAARISAGKPWPDTPNEPNPPGSIIILNAEDELADTVAPRLFRAGANMNKIAALKAIKFAAKTDRAFNLTRDIPMLDAAAVKMPDLAAIVIDPFTAYLGETDSHNNSEVRALMAPLAAFASKYGVAVICVSHLNKGQGPAIYRTMGSLAFVAAARTAWAVTRDKDDPMGERRLMLPIKNNLAKDDGGLAFRVTADTDGDTTPYIVWEDGPVATTADQSLDRDAGDDDKGPTEIDKAADWLKQALAAGPVAGKDIIKQAKECGISERTLNRGKSRANVEAFRPENPGPWFWRLPEQGEHIAKHIANDPPHTNLWQCGNVPINKGVLLPTREHIAKGICEGGNGHDPSMRTPNRAGGEQ